MTRKHTASGAAIAGAGAVTGGVGFAAGGVPGVKGDANALSSMKGIRKKPPVKRVAAVGPAAKASKAGILGYRDSAHQNFVDDEVAQGKTPGKPHNNVDAFYRGYRDGKLPSERRIIHELRGARRVSNAALIGGIGLTAYGVHRMHEPVKKSQRSDKYSGALFGAGAAGAGISHAGTHVLNSQKKRWANVAINNTKEAERLVPGLGGLKGDSMYPAKRDGEMWAERKKLRNGAGRAGMHTAGELRGEAGQARHFAEVYGGTAKVVRSFRKPSLIAAGVGAGGLALGRKHKVEKNMSTSAFGIEHISKGLVPFVAEDHSGKPKGWRFYDDHARDERGRFVSLESSTAGESAFLIEKKKKSGVTPAKVGAAAGLAGAAFVGRGRANGWGARIGNRAINHAAFSATRASKMKNPHMKMVREAFSGKLKGAGDEIKRTDDTKEVTGRAAAGLGAATIGAGATKFKQRRQ